MGYIIDFLINWGYWGMLVSAFLAGSFFPFSSEVVMSGLQAAGLDPIPLVIYGSIGNVLGSLFNYGVGRLGKMEWIEKYLHVKKADKSQYHHLYHQHHHRKSAEIYPIGLWSQLHCINI